MADLNPNASSAIPKCWGIGLGRTGTTSFCEALKILGYQRVSHNPAFEDLATLGGGADNGVTVFYKYLDYKFPGSKFVLTTRELVDWLPSIRHINQTHPIVSRETQDLGIMRRMLIYEAVAFDRDKWIAGYHRHHADVRRYFRNRPNDLLEMNIIAGDGWDKLCPFLGRPVPSEPFPHVHARSPQARAG